MNCPDGFWCMQFKDWLNVAILVITAVAIVVGPIVAVQITLRFEEKREKRRRKYDTFHALMRTRRVTLSADHVTALNVIQTEFHDDDRVIAAYKKYIDNLGGPALPPGSSNEVIRHFVDERDDTFNEMMFEIGKHLGFALDKRELAKYSYAPQAWVNMEAEQNSLRQFALELLQGKRPMPITPFQPTPSADKFPPPPSTRR
ncbi:hypothetical protein J4G48_0014510 [Bradyrhizobium barranii subsp. apii]|uniref:DUF6680 family protein n=1 Tax=Bradyrhizobium barranii TaxID=2992140 RepID=UPI001AA15A35|nr:DUF6680 family protein [Bradyrhizobium barranii]UPT99180.1 hypothetical protein J4G48_0014510 [Bradyrhizobium barranii subsp. apii]